MRRRRISSISRSTSPCPAVAWGYRLSSDPVSPPDGSAAARYRGRARRRSGCCKSCKDAPIPPSPLPSPRHANPPRKVSRLADPTVDTGGKPRSASRPWRPGSSTTHCPLPRNRKRCPGRRAVFRRLVAVCPADEPGYDFRRYITTNFPFNPCACLKRSRPGPSNRTSWS